MPDETLIKLREQQRKKRRKVLTGILIFFVVVGVLALVHLAFMYILAVGLMLVGVVSMMNMGAQAARWRYFTLPVENGGFHEFEMLEKKERVRISNWGMVVAILGFVLFLCALYLTSIGWTGLF